MLLWRGRSNDIPPRAVLEQFLFFSPSACPTIISSGISPAPLLAGNPIKRGAFPISSNRMPEGSEMERSLLLSLRFIWQETKAYLLVWRCLWFSIHGTTFPTIYSLKVEEDRAIWRFVRCPIVRFLVRIHISIFKEIRDISNYPQSILNINSVTCQAFIVY